MELVLQRGLSCHRWNDPSVGFGWVPDSAGSVSFMFAPLGMCLTHACAIGWKEGSRSSCALGPFRIQQQCAQRCDGILTQLPYSPLASYLPLSQNSVLCCRCCLRLACTLGTASETCKMACTSNFVSARSEIYFDSQSSPSLCPTAWLLTT